jgi:hypothetical protein
VTTTYVARFLGVDTSVLNGGASVGVIVGGDDALTTSDGDTSYVRVHRGGVISGSPDAHTQMPFRWDRVSGPNPPLSSITAITFTAEYRKDGLSSAVPSAFSVSTSGLTAGAPWFTNSASYEVADRVVALTFADELTDDTHPWLIFPSAPGASFVNVVRVTHLYATVEAGVPPLRQRNRDETRARLLPSRQRSIRARGYL